MVDNVLADKSFLKESNTNTLAVEATSVVRKIKRHIEITNCDHCKRVLNNIEAGDQPTSSDYDYAAHNHNPTDKLGSEYYNG